MARGATAGVVRAADGGGTGIWGVAGAFSTPIGQNWGLQIDGLGGQWGSNAFYGAAGHVFWRDPAVGLAGVYGSFKHLDTPTGSNLGQLAFEGEYYMPQATARGVVGFESLDATGRIFTRLDLDWYATPDLALTVGYHYTGGESALALDGEWLMPQGVGGHRLSLFAEGRIGQNSHNSVLAGLKLYTGQAPTLIDKHRRDDPKIDKDLLRLRQPAESSGDGGDLAAQAASPGSRAGLHFPVNPASRTISVIRMSRIARFAGDCLFVCGHHTAT